MAVHGARAQNGVSAYSASTSASTVDAPGASLTFDAALRMAEARSRQLVAQDAAASASRAMAGAAGQLPDPVLKAGVNNLPVTGADRFSLSRDFMTMRSVGVMQELTGSDKRKARSARFEREADVAGAERSVALANLRRDTAMAWLTSHYQRHIGALLRAQRAELLLQVEGADAAYRGGRGSQADALAARSAVAQIDDRILQQDRQIGTAQTRLARWIGSQPSPGSAAPPYMGAVHLVQGADLEERIGRHPMIALKARQEALARADADIAESNRRSDWTVELMFNRRGPAYSDMVSVNVAVPLQFDRRNRQDRELSARLATVAQMQAQREEAVREEVAAVQALLEQWQSNRTRLERYDKSIISLAVDRTRSLLAAYRGGAATLVAVLEARRMEIDARIERLRLEMETAEVWAQLEFLDPADDAPSLHDPSNIPSQPSQPSQVAP